MFSKKSSFHFLQFALLCAFVVVFTQASWPALAQEVVANGEKPTLAFQPPAEADDLTDLFPPSAVVVEHNQKADVSNASAPQTIQLAPQDTAVYLSPEVAVYVEGQTFKEATQLVISQITPADVVTASRPITPTIGKAPQSTTLYSFELEAVTSSTSEKGATSTALATFEKPVRVMLDLRQYGYDLNRDGGEFFVAYEDPENPGEFKGVSVTTYQPDGLISIETDHFSNWEAGWRPTSWNLTWQPPVTSEFTGSANYSYPFDIPPGRNGLQPSLALSYSSGGLQGAVKQTSHGYVASGWSLSSTNIVRDEGNFHLTLNGTGYRLFAKDANHVNGRMQFYLQDGPSLRVYNYNGWEMDNCTYWTVETADGTLYRLGYAPTQCSAHSNNAISYISKQELNQSEVKTTSAWHVDTITDVFGNQIQFNYDRPYHTDSTGLFWCPGGGGICQLTTVNHASRLISIQYNFENRVTSSSYPFPSTVARVTGNYASQIGFEYGYPGGTVSYLSAVNIYHGGSTTTPVATRSYEINAEPITVANDEECRLYHSNNTTTNPGVDTRVINSIQLKVEDELGAEQSLPATTFGYITLPHWVQGTGDCFNYKHLEEVSNGYGAKVVFTYTPDYQRGTFNTCHKQEYCSIAYPPVGLNYRVMHMWSTDGYDEEGDGKDWVLTHYLYGTACYDQVLNSWGELMCPQPLTTATTGNIAGHQSVTVTVFDAVALYNPNLRPIHRSITTYNVLDIFGNTSVYFGRPMLQTSGIPDGNGILATQKQETAHLYVHSTYATAADGQGVSFIYESQTVNRQYSGNTPPLTSKVVYEYATANQKNNLGTATQYGKLTRTEEYASEGASTPFRSTRYWYQGNTTGTSWLIVPAAQWTYADGIGNLLNGNWYYYDGATTSAAQGTVPSKGSVTRTRALTPTTLSTSCTPGCTSIDQVMTYDVYGNVLTTTSYPSYGLLTTSASGFPSTTGAQTTTLMYDPQFNLYPVKVTDPQLEVTKFEVYGFKNDGGTLINLGGFNKQAGLLRKVIGANDVKSWYEYDPFGRLYATYETGYGDTTTPAGYGDNNKADGTPEVRYEYLDTAWYGTPQINPGANQPFPITTYSQPGSTGSYDFVQTAYHDGYGRVIQTQDLNLTTEGISGLSRRIVNTGYDAMGQAYCQSAPYSIANGTGFYVTNCVSSAHTKTIAQYTDGSGLTGLGDAKIIAPDGSVSLSTNQIINTVTIGGDSVLSQTTVVDAKNNQLAQFANSKGQMVLVREFDGANSYADTQYGYDLVGNLTSVTRREPTSAGNGTLLAPVSTISYDGFGRKTGMVDPDMGSWSYRYDALGNLLEQTDAQAQHLCFYYDSLNRLQTKSYTYNSNCPASAPAQNSIFWLASYNYNNGGAGHGQISKVSWAPNAAENFESLTYDNLARVNSHTRRIDGFEYTMQTLSFDAFNRPLQIRYPDGNVATMTYDREGANTLAVTGSSLNLVHNVKYNNLGQLSYIQRNNGGYPGGNFAPDTTYTYYSATGTPGTGNNNFRLSSIAHIGANHSATYGYQYDQVGNITKLTETGQSDLNFSYDSLNRLKTVTGGFNESYAYNKLGNLTTFGSYTQTYSASKPHALVSQAGGPYGASTFAYDANGNMTQRDNATGIDYLQAFDQENRLTNVVPSTTTLIDDFNSKDASKWNFNGSYQTAPVSLSGTNVLRNVGAGGGTYAALMNRTNTLQATGVSASVDFRLSSNTVAAHFTLDSEDGWGTDGINFDRIALIANTATPYFRFNYYDNDGVAQNYNTHFAPQADTWYRVTLTVDDEMGHTINLTKRDDATVQATFRIPAGVMDKDKSWKFWHFTDAGTVYLDNYKEYTAATSFAYDPTGQRTLTMEPGRATTAYPFAGYEAERRTATQQVTFSNLGYGIDCNDNASSSGYIMYSEESVFTRFSANPPAANNAQNFVCVRYAAGVWYYHTGGTTNSLVPFPTRPTDVLVASVNYTSDTVTVLNATSGTDGGVAKGMSSSNITILADRWNGAFNDGEFQITAGSYFYRNFTLIQRSTYSLDGTPIATRVSGDTVSGNNGLFYLFTDHLGSSAFMTTSSGTVVSGSTARYAPFGGYRTTPSQTITDRGFTGHLHNDSVGLIYMNARFYLPGVGRFASADTIIPEPINPQAFNRYSYVLNNPLIYNDPSGHDVNVVFDEANNVILVQTTIEIYQYSGDAMTQAELETLALDWENSIESEWNGQTYGGVPVVFDVTVFVDTTPNSCDAQNCVGVASGTVPKGLINKVYDTGVCPRSCVFGDRESGIWDTSDPWIAAHEFGHLANLGDDYYESGGKTTALPGHELHMMADNGGTVVQHEIEYLVYYNMGYQEYQETLDFIERKKLAQSTTKVKDKNTGTTSTSTNSSKVNLE